MSEYAYIRVSTKNQCTDRQMAAIQPFNLPEDHVFCDWQSGKDFDRPAYHRLLRKMKKGDLLIVKSIDRLGRNYREILEQWQYLTKTKAVHILVLDMPLLDTRNKDGDLTGTLIADLVLQILAYVAQSERDFIRQRQAEGIAAAKARGVHFGKVRKEMPAGFEAYCELWLNKRISLDEASRTLGISRTTFWRRCEEMRTDRCG